MAIPQMPNIPGAGAMADSLDFVKNLWGSMSVPGVSIPGMAAPTLNVDELDKKIGDLKAVESWLNVNMSMLRGTIQALEVQRSTIATLKSMSSTFAAAIKQPATGEKPAAPQPTAFFQQAAAALAAQKPAEPPAPPAALPDATAPLPLANPSAWWNLLQDQFKSAVTTAMASDAIANAATMATDAAAKFTAAAAKPPASKSVAKPAAADPAAVKAPAKRAVAKPKPNKTPKP
jgi:hypothetical protein